MGRINKISKNNINRFINTLVILILFVVISFAVVVNSINRLETKLMPTFTSMCEIQVKQIVGGYIDIAIAEMRDLNLYKPSNFYTVTYDENGNVSLIENNSILINKITNDISYSLDNNLNKLGDISMKLKVFDILFPEPMDDFGPTYKMDVLKDGTANVAYKSEIKEVSGNQTNFKAYILIEVNVKLLSPIYNKDVKISRDVLIVDTMISTKNVGLKLN